MKWLIAALLLADSISAAGLPVVPLRKGLVITSSVTISRESYFLTADTSLEMPLIIIRGKHLTVDFNNCILQGSADKKFPNEFFGLAVLVEKGSSNIIIKNANIHGFKIAIMADSVEGLQIENCDLSYNYRQHLHSNWEREDISDWMSYHHNEQDEWMRYGAGIYLKDCDHAIIKNNFISGGQCGLMMMRCDSNEIYNNNFSFNSGIGIGMYRSSFNKIYANVLDFNVRGYSDGIYNRGQDSAGILMFEQSSNNEIGYNSVTHGGDGFFLWAGEHTMNTGKGGCNDNFIHENNFSYAPTNGVEVTFSRNTIKNNIIEECDNGVWGGYSFETEILANAFANNKTAIAIEQGQNNSIITNLFQKNNTAIKLWSRPSQPADWGYARSKDVSSKNYKMLSNTFIENGTAFEIMGTDSLLLEDNTVNKTRIVYKIGARTKRLDTGRIFLDDTTLTVTLEDLKKFFSNRIPKTNVFEGRNQIRITEWGPYDFRYPLLWLKNVDSIGLYHFEVLIPTGDRQPRTEWKLKTAHGFDIIQTSKDQITVKADSSVVDRFIQIEYNGPAFTDMFGKYQPANDAYAFEYSEFDPHFTWNIQFFKWDSLHDPQKSYSAFIQSLSTPFFSTTTSKVDYTWWSSIGKDLPADSFGTVATASVNLKEGSYVVGVTADDMVKLFVDGREIIDAWDPSYTGLDENTHHDKKIHLAQGAHEFKIVQADIGGLATLMFYFDRAP